MWVVELFVVRKLLVLSPRVFGCNPSCFYILSFLIEARICGIDLAWLDRRCAFASTTVSFVAHPSPLSLCLLVDWEMRWVMQTHGRMTNPSSPFFARYKIKFSPAFALVNVRCD